MKVLKIVPYEFKNASRDLREISTLRSLGCDITILAKETDDPIDYGFNMVRLSSRPIKKIIKNPTINRIISIYTWSMKARALKSEIISCHDLLCLFIGWLSTLFLKRKPSLVYDSHEFEYARNTKRNSFEKYLIKEFEGFLIKKCSFSIMVNQIIAEEVQKLHHLKDMPVVVRNIPNYWEMDIQVIKDNKERFKRDYNIGNKESLVLYQGGVVTGRGIEKSIEAMQYIDDVRLIIMGDGSSSYLDKLQNLTKSFKIEERIIFIPAVPHDELWKYTGIADVGLCNIDNICLSYYYSLPNKLFEYIQALVPVVGSNFPEIKGIIQGYHIGECCEPSNAYSIADALSKVLKEKNEPSLKENLKYAKEQLCWKNESKVLEKAYQELINQRLSSS